MAFVLAEAIRQVIGRGCSFGVPPADQNILSLKNKLNLNLGKDFTNLYLFVDGFLDYDQNSRLKLWSIDEIERNCNNYDVSVDENGVKWLPIGDYLIDSDIIVAAVELDSAEVKLLYENRLLSNSLVDLLGEMAAGKFDFL